MSKLAVVFPGIGYHKNKPLLYYSSKLVKGLGYKIIDIEYSKLPEKVKGNIAMMQKAADIAYFDVETQLKDVNFEDYEDVLFIGKSIGTFTLAKYVKEKGINVRQIWYIGDADPWSDVDKVKKMAADKGILLYSYPDCNHSLECEDVDTNIANLRDVMQKTKDYIIKEK